MARAGSRRVSSRLSQFLARGRLVDDLIETYLSQAAQARVFFVTGTVSGLSSQVGMSFHLNRSSRLSFQMDE